MSLPSSIPGEGQSDGVPSHPKYVAGTIFCASPEDRRKEGRIVGFDVERRRYQVYYPKIDAELHLLEESDLDRSHIVQDRHIRPGGRVDDCDDDDDISCPICFEVFASDPSDKLSGRLPIQARHCGHVICMGCFQERRIETTKGSSFSASIECPICRREESFVAESIVVCLTMCQLVERCKKLKFTAPPVLASTPERATDCVKRRSSADPENSNPRKKAARHCKESIANDSSIISLHSQCTPSQVIRRTMKDTTRGGQSVIDISELAHVAWKNRFGTDLLIKFTTIFMRGRHMHMAHCAGIYQNVQDGETSKWIFPTYAENEENGSICFPRFKIAKHAFLWHVLVHVATLEWRQQWLGNMMRMDGVNGTTVLIEKRRSNSLIKLVLKENTYFFSNVGGNDEWACCHE
eukprot:scaffold1522_cov39-Attheya_sp.AAC.3